MDSFFERFRVTFSHADAAKNLSCGDFFYGSSVSGAPFRVFSDADALPEQIAVTLELRRPLARNITGEIRPRER